MADYQPPAFPSAPEPQAQQPIPPAADRPRAPLAVVSVVLGAAALALEVIFQVVQAMLIFGSSYGMMGGFGLGRTVLVGALAVIGTILGFASLARERGRRGLAGVGTGIGIAGVVSVISALLYTLVISIGTSL